MSKAKDETGKTHGRLLVLGRAKENDKYGQARWVCECSCGINTIVLGAALRNGKTKSCGCLARENNSLPPGTAMLNRMYKAYAQGAVKRGYAFVLTVPQFKEITSRACHYCGIEPKQVWSRESCNGVYVYNGIDRVDNALGYVGGNVVACCQECNFGKGERGKREFLEWISRVHKHSNLPIAVRENLE